MNAFVWSWSRLLTSEKFCLLHILSVVIGLLDLNLSVNLNRKTKRFGEAFSYQIAYSEFTLLHWCLQRSPHGLSFSWRLGNFGKMYCWLPVDAPNVWNSGSVVMYSTVALTSFDWPCQIRYTDNRLSISQLSVWWFNRFRPVQFERLIAHQFRGQVILIYRNKWTTHQVK